MTFSVQKIKAQAAREVNTNNKILFSNLCQVFLLLLDDDFQDFYNEYLEAIDAYEFTDVCRNYQPDNITPVTVLLKNHLILISNNSEDVSELYTALRVATEHVR